MKTKEEIQEKIAEVRQELKEIKNDLKLSYSTIREGVKYYTGFLRALEWIIKEGVGHE